MVQNKRSKTLVNSSDAPVQNSSMSVKLPNLEKGLNKSNISQKAADKNSNGSTVKAQFERMLLLDHKYRELKGNLEKGNAKKLTEELKIPVTTKSLSRMNNPPEEIVQEEQEENKELINSYKR